MDPNPRSQCRIDRDLPEPSVEKEKVGPLKDNMGSIVTANTAAADLLNNFFSTVFTKKYHNIIPDPFMIFKGDIERDGLMSSIITPEIVEIKLEKLNVNKCPGLDGIHPKMLFEL